METPEVKERLGVARGRGQAIIMSTGDKEREIKSVAMSNGMKNSVGRSKVRRDSVKRSEGRSGDPRTKSKERSKSLGTE